ncbi:MAG: DUF4166 domain-containing protein [Proteobacteria bacterium]|nr:DUF4166 domain-containing protein [Pseudomonadota bacterium]
MAGTVGAVAGRCGRRTRAPVAGLEALLGSQAWRHLPDAVRQRFGEPPRAADYAGEFDVVRASRLGRLVALACRLLGTPVVPRTGTRVPAVVHVNPTAAGVVWNREYCWPGDSPCQVRSTKVIDPIEGLIERLPARLCMPLRVYEAAGTLHFVSRGYYFDLGRRRDGTIRKLWLPARLVPETHVAHLDEEAGWFRFTMRVTHPRAGELFFQTGRFREQVAGAGSR